MQIIISNYVRPWITKKSTYIIFLNNDGYFAVDYSSVGPKNLVIPYLIRLAIYEC